MVEVSFGGLLLGKLIKMMLEEGDGPLDDLVTTWLDFSIHAAPVVPGVFDDDDFDRRVDGR